MMGVNIVYEGIWDIKSIEIMKNETDKKVLVTYITAWFSSEEGAKDPSAKSCGFGPHSTNWQCVRIDSEQIPEISDNQSIYEYLTKTMDFKTDKKSNL
jgi:hypothetical protein